MYLQCIVMHSVGLKEKGIFNAKIPNIPQVKSQKNTLLHSV